LYTYVYLKRTIYSNPAEVIASFDQDNVLQADAARLDLMMKWITPTALDITYDGHAGTLYLQVAKYAGIDITVHQSPD
jgi:hypothetical protein